ncbi:GDP-mannose 4,6-dehydratase [Henriciella mobilis]|uniref:GDP-mannose 4,6-dehydratase n=1 Tax=Henriciella mobilis TaxID=2305467 RepID=A0A399RQZ9_9PROT|nr:GDP-mannose 4,6-dehydratase [Henriciella mobilis]RIJ32327.1 GDP-mannose 4,6-dehydratase [Henriciella mobilis]
MATTIITGITGQDGAYLARNLLDRGHTVVGTYRRTGSLNFWRIEELGITEHPNLTLAEFDLLDMGSCIRLLEKFEPDYFYNLAAQSFVGVSFGQPVSTAQITGIGPLHCLEAIRSVNPRVRFYQASSSELYGKVVEVPQNEDTPFYPRSPYAVAKLYAHWMTVNYRESYDIFGVSGILFNHESPLRGREFVTRKITNAAAAIKLGKQDCLELGNLDAKRDWGFADEYVEGMRLMLEETDAPDTYVLATGQTWTVRHFVELAFKAIDVEIDWKGEGVDEVGVCTKTGRQVVRVNPEYFRPAEVELLIGDASKAERELGWKAKTSIEELARMMVEADLRRNERGASF